MPAADDGYSFVISVADFDKTVLPPHARTPGTDEFSHEVSQFFQKEFTAFKGRRRSSWMPTTSRSVGIPTRSNRIQCNM